MRKRLNGSGGESSRWSSSGIRAAEWKSRRRCFYQERRQGWFDCRSRLIYHLAEGRLRGGPQTAERASSGQVRGGGNWGLRIRIAAGCRCDRRHKPVRATPKRVSEFPAGHTHHNQREHEGELFQRQGSSVSCIHAIVPGFKRTARRRIAAIAIDRANFERVYVSLNPSETHDDRSRRRIEPAAFYSDAPAHMADFH